MPEPIMKKPIIAGFLALCLFTGVSAGAWKIASAQTAGSGTTTQQAETTDSDKGKEPGHASNPDADCSQCHGASKKPPAAGSISTQQGLEAWSRIFEVASHPRCANCHVGADNRPMWSGPSYGKTRFHGMNINAGESRIGAETLTCSTCHTSANTPIAHGAPGSEVWHLPPVEMEWFGKTSSEVCAQLKNPETNGERSFMELAAHIGHDELVHWGWAPGIGREPAPYSIAEHANDFLVWGTAGMPCPGE